MVAYFMQFAVMIYAAGVIAYSVILCWRVASRKATLKVRTFRIYFGSTLLMAAAGVVAFALIATRQADVTLAFALPISIYPLREIWLGADGRKEVTNARIKVFRSRP